jgi:hypothetical protein
VVKNGGLRCANPPYGPYWSLNQLSQAIAGIENAPDRWYFLDENGERQLIGALRKLPLPQPRPQCRGLSI